jgi:hypothetical protein
MASHRSTEWNSARTLMLFLTRLATELRRGVGQVQRISLVEFPHDRSYLHAAVIIRSRGGGWLRSWIFFELLHYRRILHSDEGLARD